MSHAATWILQNDSLAEQGLELTQAFARLQITPMLREQMMGDIDVDISGYDDDPRELYEVP